MVLMRKARTWSHNGATVTEDDSRGERERLKDPERPPPSQRSTTTTAKTARREPGPDDVFIAVMGVTGAGKSSFISLLSDDPVKIGHGLQSTTRNVDIYRFGQGSEGRQGWLIDTPGFDDTTRSDTEILQEIAAFLARMHTEGLRLSGLIYLHRITDVRMGGTAVKNLNAFKALCGSQTFPRVRLVTTFWDQLKPQTADFATAERNEDQLCRSDKYWLPILAAGGRTMRHSGVRASAVAVLNSFASSVKLQSPLAIQHEMIDLKLKLSETTAGRLIEREQEALKKRYEAELEDLKEQKEEAMQERDKEMLQTIAREEQNCLKQQKNLGEAVEGLNMTFSDLNDQNQTNSLLSAEPGRGEEIKNDLRLLQQEVKEVTDELARLKRDRLKRHRSHDPLGDGRYNVVDREPRRDEQELSIPAQYHQQQRLLRRLNERQRQPDVISMVGDWFRNKFLEIGMMP